MSQKHAKYERLASKWLPASGPPTSGTFAAIVPTFAPIIRLKLYMLIPHAVFIALHPALVNHICLVFLV